MKKLLLSASILALAGCQTTNGVVTPLKEGYLAQASVDSGNALEAKAAALKAAEDTCMKKGMDFYVINETTDGSPDINLNQDFVAFSNTLSNTFLDDDMFKQERSITLEFDCK